MFWSLLLISKVVTLQVWNFINEVLQRRCFPVNMVKFLRTAFFLEHLRWLLLDLLMTSRYFFGQLNNVFIIVFPRSIDINLLVNIRTFVQNCMKLFVKITFKHLFFCKAPHYDLWYELILVTVSFHKTENILVV